MKYLKPCFKVMVDSHFALALSISACLLFCTVMVGVGVARGWNCDDSGAFKFQTVDDNLRFWAEPGRMGTSLASAVNTSVNGADLSLPGRDFASAESNWYYWKVSSSFNETLRYV